MNQTRNNHYVAQWYQRGFLNQGESRLHYLDLRPDRRVLSDGREIVKNNRSSRPTAECFRQLDLYTTAFGQHINDDIERLLFGRIDDSGARAMRAYIANDQVEQHHRFQDFYSYMDTQKLRTPKGLAWIRHRYPELSQLELMLEMQAIRNLHCTLWTEGVREIISAERSAMKFIVTDHPVTVYNYACSPASEYCEYPNDPSVSFKATQTLYPLDKDHCLILSNLEYAQNPESEDPLEKRTNPVPFRQSLVVRTDSMIRSRYASDTDVIRINRIMKSRARRYIAAAQEEWLYPEEHDDIEWAELRTVLLPPSNELYQFAGETYVGFKDGSTLYQDAFGRTVPENEYLKKAAPKNIGRNDYCGCGSGRKYKKCCENKREQDRPAWDVLSIRERNLTLLNGVTNILGLNEGRDWDDVRRDLSDKQVSDIHGLYGALWPVNTDIFRLLPRPDEKLRVLYSGLVDPQIAPLFTVGAAPYFDEILIQHPFVNPSAVKPEFSPVESPHQYKQQTLKNLMLLLYLQPFIELGVINFIPDPCTFNRHLQGQMMRMAEKRRKDIDMDSDEAERFRRLQTEDLKRSIRGLPREQRIRQIKQAIPDISPEKVEDVLQYMDRQYKEDPLALLQNDLLERGGQMAVTNLAPNYEMSLFVGQVTGSIILTNSDMRWAELESAAGKEGSDSSTWSELCDYLGSLEYYLSANPNDSIRHCMSGEFGDIRKALRQIVTAAATHRDDANKVLINKLQADAGKGAEKAAKQYDPSDLSTFQVNFRFRKPDSGYVDKSVQRLLLTSDSHHHRDNVPMAVFASPVDRS